MLIFNQQMITFSAPFLQVKIRKIQQNPFNLSGSITPKETHRSVRTLTILVHSSNEPVIVVLLFHIYRQINLNAAKLLLN